MKYLILLALLCACNNSQPVELCINELDATRHEANTYFVKACENNSMYQMTMRELCISNRSKAEELMTRFKLDHGCERYDRRK